MPKNVQEQAAQLKNAIATLESQREILGEAVVEASLSALRKQLAEIEAETTDKQTGDFLWRMCQEAATSTLRRILKHNEIKDEEISKERLERIKVNMDDFLNAFKRLVK